MEKAICAMEIHARYSIFWDSEFKTPEMTPSAESSPRLSPASATSSPAPRPPPYHDVPICFSDQNHSLLHFFGVRVYQATFQSLFRPLVPFQNCQYPGRTFLGRTFFLSSGLSVEVPSMDLVLKSLLFTTSSSLIWPGPSQASASQFIIDRLRVVTNGGRQLSVGEF